MVRLGSHLLDGNLRSSPREQWQGGNYLAEGQWGIWNPLTWLVALTMHATNGATLAVTVVKLAFLVALCVGAFLLARSYGAAPWWAAIAGFTVTAGGQTVFMDAPSWVTGLQTIALFAFVWWALKRHLDSGSNPVLYFVFSYLLVTIGYVFAVLEVAALLLRVPRARVARPRPASRGTHPRARAFPRCSPSSCTCRESSPPR